MTKVPLDSLLTRIKGQSVTWLTILLLSTIWSSAWATRDSLQGTTETEDGSSRSGSPANSYGGTTVPICDKYDTRMFFIRPVGVATKLGASATINACTLYVYMSTAPATSKTVNWWRIFKPWSEGSTNDADPGTGHGATWNCWDAISTDSSGWGTVGCANVSDAGSDNSSKGSGNDRTSTTMGSVATGTTSAVWLKLPITTATAQGWYDATMVENGVAVATTASGAWGVNASESASNKPYFVFEFTTSATALPSAIYKQGVSGLIYKAGESGKRSKP